MKKLRDGKIIIYINVLKSFVTAAFTLSNFNISELGTLNTIFLELFWSFIRNFGFMSFYLIMLGEWIVTSWVIFNLSQGQEVVKKRRHAILGGIPLLVGFFYGVYLKFKTKKTSMET
tara:strand:+ start:31 stop:381 length:351 start_codon:yes stop_codon:yes gene_type:complete